MAESPAGAPSAQDVFLTPRVIDKSAFEEFSLHLRGLIQQASGEGASLRHALVEFKSFDQSARAVTGELQRRMEAVARAIPALDERLAGIDRLMRASIDPATFAQQAEREIEVAVSRRLDAALERTHAAAQAIEERLARLEHERLELLARIEGQRAERLEQAAAHADRTAEACERRLADATHIASTRANESAGAIEARLGELTRHAESLLGRLESAQGAASGTGESPAAEERLTRLGASIEQRVGQIKVELAAATGPAVSNLSLLCHRAVDILGRDPRIPPDQIGAPPHRPGSLGDAVARAERSLEGAQQVTRQADMVRQQAEQIHSAVRDAVLHGAEWADGLNARVDRARRNAADAERVCDRVERSLAANAANVQAAASLLSGDRAEALASRLAELRAGTTRLEESERAARETLANAHESWYRAESLGARVRELQAAMELAEERSRGLAFNALTRLKELESLLDGSVQSLDGRAGQIESRLDQVIRQAALAASGANEQAVLARESEERLKTLAQALESWRGVLKSDAGAELPAPLSAIVTDFRTRLEHQVGRAATLAMEFERRLGCADDVPAPTRKPVKSAPAAATKAKRGATRTKASK